MADTRPPSRHLVVLHTVASLDRREGGVPRSVVAVVGRLRRAGCEARILAVEKTSVSLQLADRPAVDPIHEAIPASRYGRRQTLRQLDASAIAAPIDLVHDHGIWLPMHNAIASWCRRRGVPRVVSIRGMLNPWARRHHAARKWVAWHTYQRDDLAAADALHATSDPEYAAIRAAGLRQPVIVLPNGVEGPPTVSEKRPRGVRTALFLSRLHPSKGVEALLHAWREAAPAGWRLVIAGAGAAAYERSITARIATLGLTGVVALHGAVDDSTKWPLYEASDLFILPSLSENFGTVVAEALASGLPVITTQATPWDWLPARRAGWWVPVDGGGLADALREAAALPAAELQSMGERGRAFVRERFEWAAVAREFIAAYRWLVGHGSMPACVRL